MNDVEHPREIRDSVQTSTRPFFFWLLPRRRRRRRRWYRRRPRLLDGCAAGRNGETAVGDTQNARNGERFDPETGYITEPSRDTPPQARSLLESGWKRPKTGRTAPTRFQAGVAWDTTSEALVGMRCEEAMQSVVFVVFALARLSQHETTTEPTTQHNTTVRWRGGVSVGA